MCGNGHLQAGLCSQAVKTDEQAMAGGVCFVFLLHIYFAFFRGRATGQELPQLPKTAEEALAS